MKRRRVTVILDIAYRDGIDPVDAIDSLLDLGILQDAVLEGLRDRDVIGATIEYSVCRANGPPGFKATG